MSKLPENPIHTLPDGRRVCTYSPEQGRAAIYLSDGTLLYRHLYRDASGSRWVVIGDPDRHYVRELPDGSWEIDSDRNAALNQMRGYSL